MAAVDVKKARFCGGSVFITVCVSQQAKVKQGKVTPEPLDVIIVVIHCVVLCFSFASLLFSVCLY